MNRRPKELIETVMVTRPVDRRIADLVRFARFLEVKGTDEELIRSAQIWWNREHGED